MRAPWLSLCVFAIAVLLPADSGLALINPKFTPVDLVGQSGLIAEVDLRPADAKDKYLAAVRTVVKGKADGKPLAFDMSGAANAQTAEALRGVLAAADKAPSLLFAGRPKEVGDEGGRVGYLHVGGQWVECRSEQEGVWSFSQVDAHMQGVWAGGTDMLRRCVDYILSERRPRVPVEAEAVWQPEPVKLGKVEGRIRAVRPVDLAGDGKLLVFVAADSGDRLYACDRKAAGAADITAARKLQSKSRAYAWGDFSGHGRLDLVSFDGAALSLHAQQADGTFAAGRAVPADLVAGGCVALAALDGGRGRSLLLVTTPSRPVVVDLGAEGKPATTALEAKAVNVASLGRPGACLVADFDGDGLPDILQPLAKGSVFFKGTAAGKFAPGVACPVGLGAGATAACLGDFDGDGRLDLFSVAEDGCRLWQNEGGGRFAECLSLSGEIAYISKPGGIACASGDVNNDGRQDLLVVYGALGPQVFFNRGFRSFGHAHTLVVGEKRLLPEADEGQQAGCLADFDGDGAQDLCLAMKNGDIVIFYRDTEDEQICSATVFLGPGAAWHGPVTVTGWAGRRCLGAWNVAPGTDLGFFGLRQPGAVTIRWKTPDGVEREKEVAVGAKPVRVEIK